LLVILGFTTYSRVSGRFRVIDAALIAFWVIVPPGWFWIEYFHVVPKMRNEDLPNVDRFKYGQDLSAKFWIAGSALLTAIYWLGLKSV
jgi:hypothetical protein